MSSEYTMARRASGPVRQLSFQQPPQRQQQAQQQEQPHREPQVRRQRSNDESRARGGCEPRVREAWTEPGVQVIARQIATGRASGGRPRMGRASVGEKPTILYSRQELAERLRLAWRQRAENRANIDIFLAHATVEESGGPVEAPETRPESPDYSRARLRRASYRSGSNRAFVGPILPTGPAPRPRRTSSAPPQRRSHGPVVAERPEAPVQRPIKSAPPSKRRGRAGRRRKEPEGLASATEPRPVDVVTMVSLVSSAESESEAEGNSPRDDKLICELRNKLSTTPIIKSSNGLSGSIRKPFKSVSFQQDSFEGETSPTVQREGSEGPRPQTPLESRFVGLRRHATEDSTSTYQPWPLPASCSPTFCQEEVPLTDREKRCLAVPIGDDLNRKRRLVRCRSAIAAPKFTDTEKQSSCTSEACMQTEMHISQITSQTSLILQERNVCKILPNQVTPKTESNLEKNKNLSSAPYCQTPKEKECWHLYQRMCDKGVFVSFDTVLRGMLTPTEYRLRQKELSQNF